MSQQLELGGYQVVGRIAVGGMAEVYQARALQGTQKSAGEPDDVVLKRLLPAYRNDGGYVKQFVDEAKLTVRLRHPNIVRTFRCFKAGIDYLMVQELVSGRPLSYMQDLLLKGGTPMPPSAATYIVYCVVKALDYIHRAKVTDSGGAIVHRDVNPANILLSVSGDVKLTDFGVADAEGLSRGESGALRGTLPYMSPEQVMGEAVDPRSDLYAAGIVLWELLANRKLRDGGSEMELMHQGRDAKAALLFGLPEVPDYAAQITRRALMADKKLRFQTAAEFQKALEILAMRHGWPLTADALKPLLGG
ncbi:MAG: serine/threonine protein kinase [Myxococcaceae bacterium]